jgi:hypothetical protein
MTESEQGFTAELSAEVTAAAEHPAGLTPEQREHLGLPADEDQQEEQ